MKIGILTHQYINNYGAFLQAWALREAIAELFPNDEVQIIDYVNLKHFIINAGGWFRFYKNRESFKDWMEKIKLPRTFAKARNQEMILSKRCFNAKQINALDFDCIIVGSDEVWNYKDTKGNAALKFGEGLTCKNLIAYAPSVGKTAADECVPEYVIRGIKKFKKISARDDLTEQLVCNITGTAPERVLLLLHLRQSANYQHLSLLAGKFGLSRYAAFESAPSYHLPALCRHRQRPAMQVRPEETQNRQ